MIPLGRASMTCERRYSASWRLQYSRLGACAAAAACAACAHGLMQPSRVLAPAFESVRRGLGRARRGTLPRRACALI